MNKRKKIGLWILGILDVAVTVFLFVVAIIMIVQSTTLTTAEIRTNTGMIGYFQNHPTVYLWVGVVPLFVLLALDIVFLVLYTKKSTEKKKNVQMSDLSDDQKEELRREILSELGSKDEAKKTDNPSSDGKSEK